MVGGIFQLCVCVYVCACTCTQLCLTLCGLMDCIPPGFSVHGILQAKNCSGVPFPSPWDHPDPGIKTVSCLLHCRQILYYCATGEASYDAMAATFLGVLIVCLGRFELSTTILWTGYYNYSYFIDAETQERLTCPRGQRL